MVAPASQRRFANGCDTTIYRDEFGRSPSLAGLSAAVSRIHRITIADAACRGKDFRPSWAWICGMYDCCTHLAVGGFTTDPACLANGEDLPSGETTF